ncbi:MAG: hypothetical protein JOZ81_03770 [Chloroflexi bacterium]|nr:hypothetical protein [Chloroflexota bacterium]
MAVSPAHLALFNFALDRTPWFLVLEHPSDIPPLCRGIHMVEIQHDRIRLPAINAWMRFEVQKHAPVQYAFQ